MVDDIDHSILSSIGQTFAWIFSPLGWGDWKAAVARLDTQADDMLSKVWFAKGNKY